MCLVYFRFSSDGFSFISSYMQITLLFPYFVSSVCSLSCIILSAQFYSVSSAFFRQLSFVLSAHFCFVLSTLFCHLSFVLSCQLRFFQGSFVLSPPLYASLNFFILYQIHCFTSSYVRVMNFIKVDNRQAFKDRKLTLKCFQG